jgi:hypothetical protein
MKSSGCRFTLALPVGLILWALAGCAGISPVTDAPYRPRIEAREFVSVIDHPFLPLRPGARFVYEGATEKGRERIEVTVTDQTREVMGVACVVVRDTVWANGELIEDTFDWYAQDRQGNVWYFGEDTKEYQHGVLVSSEGSWEAGVDGAQPGLVMKAQPDRRDSYRQEYYAGHAEDMAQVVALGRRVSVPAGSFAGCLKILEWTPLEPGAAEYKYYAPNVGLVLETARGSFQRVRLVEYDLGSAAAGGADL